MPSSRLGRAIASRGALGVAVALFPGLLASCDKERPLLPKSQTWAELRVVRSPVSVLPPGESERAPYPRERLVDGEVVTVLEGGVAWVRRDGGAEMLVRGPARLTMRAGRVEVDKGRLFVDTPASVATEIAVPEGPLHLAQVRASIDVGVDGRGTEAYVLSGELRAAEGSERAGPGEMLVFSGGKAERRGVLAWEDWTGGLATTDAAASPSPFGVGTVGARKPGQVGAPRFPLAIQKLDVRVRIEGDFALTEVDEVFFNPSSDTVEGIYRFRTPEASTLHRFGVDREGVVVWGRVKEKAAAAAQYQSNVYAGSTEDPALLEWEAPGVYRARLYPIGPGESRRVVVRYGEWLGRSGVRGERRLYVYPMAAEGTEGSLPHIEEMTARVDLEKSGATDVRVGMEGVRSGETLVVKKQDFVPRADLAVELFDGGQGSPRGFVSPHVVDLETMAPTDRAEAKTRAEGEADYVVVPVRAADLPRQEGGVDLAVVVDASAATDPSALALARAATGAMLAHLSDGDRVAVFAGDDRLRAVVPGQAGMRPLTENTRREILTHLARLERGGATDLGALLAEASQKLDPGRRGAVVYVGDGVPTVGELALPDLRKRLDELPRPVRVFCLGVGDAPNMALLAGVARGAFAERVGDGAEAARAALRLLEEADRPARLGASVDLGPSVERIFPRDLSALVADEEAFVVGRIASGKGVPKEVVIRSPAGTATLPLEVKTFDDAGDLGRRWAEARLAQMLDEGAGRAAMVDVGMRHGIITPFTSLYVPTKREMSPEERAELEQAKRTARRRLDEEVEEDETVQVAEPNSDSKPSSDSKEGGTGARAAREPSAPNAPNAPWGRDDSATGSKAEALEAQMASAKDEISAAAAEAQLRRAAAGRGSAPNAPSPSAACAPGDPLCSDPPSSPAPAAPPADPLSARGNLWGAELGDSFGGGGLGLSGVGEGGGGKGDPELGKVGTLGHGSGTRSGQGFGSGGGRLGGAGRRAATQVRLREPTVGGAGQLPAEVIRRVVGQNMGRFRRCYESGLAANPKLSGRVTVRFGIDRNGTPTAPMNGGSDLPSGEVVGCVARAFGSLSFPAPAGGSVTVTCPLLMSPDGGDQPAADAPPPPSSGPLELELGVIAHFVTACSAAADAPLGDRVALWRERLAKQGGYPQGVLGVYEDALERCEAPSFRERSRLLSMMIDALPTVADRVELWRLLLPGEGGGALEPADLVYRGILARVRTPADRRDLHAALGLKAMDPGELTRAVSAAASPEARVGTLRALSAEWPDDHAVLLRLLGALEDAGDDEGARALGRALRRRPDADAALRTAVGELGFRLAARAKSPAQKEADLADARRAFGEIVEFSPDDPALRRRLGDLLRAHGFFAEATRHYETLAKLAPDDPSVGLLLAATAEGMGKLDEAIRRTEEAATAGAPGAEGGPGATARALAATYLAWGRLAAREAGKKDELLALRTRLARVLSAEVGGARPAADKGARAARVSLVWSHPEFHPQLWTSSRGAPMPAQGGDVTLGIVEARVSAASEGVVEVRLEPEEVEDAARLGARAWLTAVFDEGEESERVVRLPVVFARGGGARLRYALSPGSLTALPDAKAEVTP